MFKINLNDSMLYFGLYVQLRRGSVAGYTTDESWAYGPKEGVEAFESITFFKRFIYAINFGHLLNGCKEVSCCKIKKKVRKLLSFFIKMFRERKVQQ